MCRMVGYLGAPLAPASLLAQPAHSLLTQSYRPREMTSGTVNADGWGAALWLDDGRPDPVLYRSPAPIWADPNLGWLGERLGARALLAAVRSATPGIGYELSSIQPFARGAVALVHNGYLSGFRQGPQRALRESLGRAAYESIQGGSDSEHVFALVLDALDQGARTLGEALARATARLGELCRKLNTTAVATLLLSDGRSLAGCRWASGTAPASLYLASFPAEGASGWCLASEPLDLAAGASPPGADPAPRGRWQEIPPGALVELRPGEPPRIAPLGEALQ